MRVKDGRVQKKNNWRLAPDDYYARPQAEIRIDRRDPAWGCRHLITVAQLRRFLALLPEWDEVAIGLDAVVLDSADDCMGWHSPGVVAVCAWEHELWWEDAAPSFVEEHRVIFDLIGVHYAPRDEDNFEVRWTEEQARAFQLLHILPHELGHHHDRMRTRSRARAARGEPYAEAYSHRVLEQLWPVYAREFEL